MLRTLAIGGVTHNIHVTDGITVLPPDPSARPKAHGSRTEAPKDLAWLAAQGWTVLGAQSPADADGKALPGSAAETKTGWPVITSETGRVTVVSPNLHIRLRAGATEARLREVLACFDVAYRGRESFLPQLHKAQVLEPIKVFDVVSHLAELPEIESVEPILIEPFEHRDASTR
ncbi:MAG: hypothetical protein EAZ99_04865 [Alphaproteobacteria bacterium]|nr:MAG: hypothetical protein EAZ99_04865 [Alphaproteobacteria bacterium]